MSGPLPNPQKRRRNAPTIATTALPAKGRKGKAPKCPYTLGKAGKAWWNWAWKLPQATVWGKGGLYALARRAQLEDDLDAISLSDELELADLLAGADEEAVERVAYALDTLKKAATGKLAIAKEMRELDNRFGLNSKAMADLRWSIEEEEEGKGRREKPTLGRHLRAVDSSAA